MRVMRRIRSQETLSPFGALCERFRYLRVHHDYRAMVNSKVKGEIFTMNSLIFKRIVFSFVILFVASIPSLAQESFEATLSTTAGELFPFSPGQLALGNAYLNTVIVNGEWVLAGQAGSATFTTPEFSSGTVAAGGSFDAGGSFYIWSIYN